MNIIPNVNPDLWGLHFFVDNDDELDQWTMLVTATPLIAWRLQESIHAGFSIEPIFSKNHHGANVRTLLYDCRNMLFSDTELAFDMGRETPMNVLHRVIDRGLRQQITADNLNAMAVDLSEQMMEMFERDPFDRWNAND